MRPQGFAHAGFFPLTEGGAKTAVEQLKVECDPRMISVLDPCIGDGVALKRIVDALGVPYENICGVELTRNRGDEARALLPGARIISPACFLSGVNRPERAFTFVYCNPPYADEAGGGYRVETQFLDKIGHMVPIGAVLLMVVPFNTTTVSYFTATLARYWRRVRVKRLAPQDAPYNETLIVAYRHNNKAAWGEHFNTNYESVEMTQKDYDEDDAPPTDNPEPYGSPFIIPPAKRIIGDVLHKVMLTDEEIKDHLLSSTIEREISTPPPIDRGRPPLALTTGHNGILVASGQAPPVVTLRDQKGRMLEVPHIIRGVARKEQYIKSRTTEENEDGTQAKTKTVISESVDLKMMVLLHTGTIVNLNEDRDSRPIETPPTVKVSMLHSEEGSHDGGIGI